MAGVLNKTSRMINLRGDSGGHRVTVRLAPGFSVVDDAEWSVVSKSDFVKGLKEDGSLQWGRGQKAATDAKKAASKKQNLEKLAEQAESGADGG